MGNFRFGIPRDLILELQARFELPYFVETGTYRGETSNWAAKHFEYVYTIEKAQSIYEMTSKKYEAIQNIDFILGDSRTHLNSILSSLNKPSLIWLDGHWSGGETYGHKDECPLMEELAIIKEASIELKHYILIDDARLFLSPPPEPFTIHEWPSIAEVVSSIQRISEEYYLIIVEDVIIAVPPEAQSFLASYAQNLNTEERLIQRKKGLKLMTRGINTIFDGSRVLIYNLLKR